MKASESSKTSVRGVTFFPKISKYINDHYIVGELYMKVIKDTFKVKEDQQCVSCTNGWQGSKMDRIPRPFSNKETFRCKSVFDFPATSPDRKTRLVVDFMPRAQIKKYFNEEKLNTPKDMTCTRRASFEQQQ